MSTASRAKKPPRRPLSQASPAFVNRTQRLVKEVSASLAKKYQMRADFIEIESGMFRTQEENTFTYAHVMSVYSVFNMLRMGFDILDPILKPNQLVDRKVSKRRLLQVSRHFRIHTSRALLLLMIAFEVHLHRSRHIG